MQGRFIYIFFYAVLPLYGGGKEIEINKPKIGIRPTIDGRWGGVRESLEEKTMAMAKAAKELIEKNVHYQDGTPVECVISPSTIGGGAEAAKCAEYFSTQNVCASLAVTPFWCYGSKTMDLSGDTVKAVWGFNGTERPGAAKDADGNSTIKEWWNMTEP